MKGYNKIGNVTIKGLTYEDIVSILCNNGYTTKVITRESNKKI